VLCFQTWDHLYRYSAFYQALHERGFEYFEEYCKFDIHCLMLFQIPRAETYVFNIVSEKMMTYISKVELSKESLWDL